MPLLLSFSRVNNDLFKFFFHFFSATSHVSPTSLTLNSGKRPWGHENFSHSTSAQVKYTYAILCKFLLFVDGCIL